MFRKILIFAMFIAAAGYAFASDSGDNVSVSDAKATVPVWPLPGSDADVTVQPNGKDVLDRNRRNDNIRIVSKIGADMTIQNNIDMAGMGGSSVNSDLGDGATWSGGANMLHGYQAPRGFNIYEKNAEMPLMHQEMLEDDGSSVLAMSRSDRTARSNIGGTGGMNIINNISGFGFGGSGGGMAFGTAGGGDMTVSGADGDVTLDANGNLTQMAVDTPDDVEPAKDIPDQVRSWVVASGQTLREVLQDWCNREGWDLVWATSREYPVEASAVFKGRFVDVASALVRNFSRATPVPYAKFYKGNRVLVVSTTED